VATDPDKCPRCGGKVQRTGDTRRITPTRKQIVLDQGYCTACKAQVFRPQGIAAVGWQLRDS
jgi:C4-type Zn-finger protein